MPYSDYPISGTAVSGPDASSTLLAVWQSAIAAITGLPGKFVRPRWQRNAPIRPGADVNWCGFGISGTTPDNDAYVTTQGESGTLVRYKTGTLAISFYGPNCQENAEVLRDGLEVPFNRSALSAQAIAIVRSEPTVHVPEQVDDLWYDRADVSFLITWETRRTYAILSFVSASGIIYGHGPDPAITVPFSVSQ